MRVNGLSSLTSLARVVRLVVLFGWVAVAARDCVPGPPNSQALNLQQTINKAIQNNVQSLSIPKDNYVFSNRTFLIENANDMVIQADSGTIFTFFFGFGVQFVTCHNVTVEGISVDYDPPNYSQGTVVSSEKQTFVASFEDAYIPPDTTKQPYVAPGGIVGAKVAFWNPSTFRMVVIPQVFMGNSTFVSTNTWNITLTFPMAAPMPSKTLVTVFPRRGITWDIHNSSQVVSRDITLYGGGNMGFHEQFGAGGNRYENVRIIRKPITPIPPLLAMNADGFHSSDVGTGPTLMNSEISFTGDDFLNIHNKMLVICKTLGPSSLAIIDVSSGALQSLKAGNTFKFYKLNSDVYLDTGIVNSFALATEASDMELLKECAETFDNMKNPPFNTKFTIKSIPNIVYKIGFTESLAANVSATRYNLANFESRSSANAVVQDNYFHDGHSRMGLLKGINLTYVNNLVERAGGLHVSPEQNWLEGDLGLRNVLLRNNTVIDNTSQTPHVQVAGGLSNITCVNNTFIESGVRYHYATGC